MLLSLIWCYFALLLVGLRTDSVFSSAIGLSIMLVKLAVVFFGLFGLWQATYPAAAAFCMGYAEAFGKGCALGVRMTPSSTSLRSGNLRGTSSLNSLDVELDDEGSGAVHRHTDTEGPATGAVGDHA